jgi:pimeloyl-ACP methyl ester carboxylesterase
MWPKSYADHIRRAEERLTTFDPKAVDSAWGTIEYAERGTGIPLLVSHGIDGGFDAAIKTAKVWAGDGFQVIGPSRFGYFRSTLPRNANPALQADAFAALLDALDVERAAVLGFSAGGPPAIQFALRHPERTLSLVLASAHLPTSPNVKLPAVLYRAVFSERLFWLLKTLAPGRLARIMGVPKGSGPPLTSGNRSATSWTVCSRSGPGGREPCSTRSSPIPTWRAIHWRRSRFPR